MRNVAAALFMAGLLMSGIGSCETMFDIAAGDTLANLRSKLTYINPSKLNSDSDFPLYEARSLGIRGVLGITFFDDRALDWVSSCVKAWPAESALSVVRVQFVPDVPPPKEAVVAKYGRDYVERYDENFRKTLVWERKGITAILVPSGRTVESVINDFTVSELEKALQTRGALLTITNLGCK